MLNFQKPSSGGLFFIILLLLGICLPTLVLPGLFYQTQVSQRIWALLFLDAVVLTLCLGRIPVRLPVGLAAWLVYGGMFLALVFSGPNLLVLSIILTAFLLFLLVPQVLDVSSASLLLAASALVAALFGLYHFWDAGAVGRLRGIFNQPNLFGCFLLAGLFCYLQALFSLKRQRWLDFSPALVIGFVAFLSFSRAITLAFILSFLLVVWIFRRNELWREYRTFAIRGAFVLLLAYLLANAVPYTEGIRMKGGIEQLAALEGDQSAYVRLNYWFSAILIGLQHFWTGAGIGGYREWLGEYTIQAAEILKLTYDSFTQTIWAHNDFLHVFAELGFPVFAALVLSFLMVFLSARDPQRKGHLFLLAAFTSFAVCMMFGHPLFYPATAFVFVVIAGLLFPWKTESRVLSRRWVAAVLLPILLGIHLLMAHHVWDMYQLEQGRVELMSARDVSGERYAAVEEEWFQNSWDDGIHGWLFQSLVLARTSTQAFWNDDSVLAGHLLPRVLDLREKNRFHSLAYTTARLYFTLDDYEASRDYAFEAFEKKPDINAYFDLYHLNNAFIISRDNSIPLDQLIRAEDLEMLKESEIVRPRHLNDKGIVKAERPDSSI